MYSPANRDVGSYPLSIATSLAIEGAIGIHPDHPAGKHLLGDFDQLWVNLKTLYRNYYNAIGRENVTTTNLEDLTNYFDMEITNLVKVVDAEGQSKVRVQYYLPDYSSVEKKFSHALVRVDATDYQKAYTESLIAVMHEILEHRKDEIKLYNDLITDSVSQKVLLLTHFPIDLTTNAFRHHALLESHTGNIKTREAWYTKFYNGKQLDSIPFTQGFLSVFGDNEMFRPIPIQYRKALIDLSKQYRWSFATTRDKIVYGLDTLRDRYMAEQLKIWLFTHL